MNYKVITSIIFQVIEPWSVLLKFPEVSASIMKATFSEGILFGFLSPIEDGLRS